MLTITCNLVIEDDGGAVMAGDGHGARQWTNFSASFLTPAIASAVLGAKPNVRERVESFKLVQEWASKSKYWRNHEENGGVGGVVRTVMIDGAVKIDGSWWIDDAVMAMGLVMTVRSQSGLTEKVGFVGSHYFWFKAR